jgi:hypothetical protein
MAAESYEPDWGAWLLVRAYTLEEAVALSLNVDPRRLLAWKMSKARNQRTGIAKFEDRIYWVEKWGLRDPNGIAAAIEGWTPKIYPREFVQHAKDANWELPDPLLTLIAADAGEGTVVVAEGPDEKDGTDASQTTLRPLGISETAWERYRRARAFDPRFDEKSGGISKAARRIAREDQTNNESVRRDLSRVLRTQRGQVGQK